MADKETTGRELVYTPAEVARYTLEEIERRRANPTAGIPMGLATVDKVMKPLRPGELVTIVGRPSHYKSGLAQWWARWLAADCQGQEAGGCVVYGTTEMSIEEHGIYDLANAANLDAGAVGAGELSDGEWAAVQAASMRRGALPLWLLGHSLARRKERVRMTVFLIERALYWIEDNMDFRARVVFLDYLNLLQSERKAGQRPDRRVDISEIVACAKDLALTMGCPVVLLAQANREADKREWKMPMMADCMETAAIEQYSDKVFSVWMPKVEATTDHITDPNGERLEITDNLLLLGLVKQKNGKAGGYFKLYVDHDRNEIRPLETRQEEPPAWYGEREAWG